MVLIGSPPLAVEGGRGAPQSAGDSSASGCGSRLQPRPHGWPAERRRSAETLARLERWEGEAGSRRTERWWVARRDVAALKSFHLISIGSSPSYSLG